MSGFIINTFFVVAIFLSSSEIFATPPEVDVNKTKRAELIKEIKPPSLTKSHTREADTNRRQAFSSGVMDTLEPLKDLTKFRHFKSAVKNGWKDSKSLDLVVHNSGESRPKSIDLPSKGRICRAFKNIGAYKEVYAETSKLKNDLRCLSHSYVQTLDKASEINIQDEEPKLFKKTYQAERMHTALKEVTKNLDDRNSDLFRSNFSTEIEKAQELAEQPPTQYINDANKDGYQKWKSDESESLVKYEKKQERWRQNGRQTGQVTRSTIAVGKAAGLAVASGGISLANGLGVVAPVITSGLHAGVIEWNTKERMKTLSMSDYPADRRLKVMREHDKVEGQMKVKFVDSAVAVSAFTGIGSNGLSITQSGGNLTKMFGAVGGELNQASKSVAAGTNMWKEAKNGGKSIRADMRKAEIQKVLTATDPHTIVQAPPGGTTNPISPTQTDEISIVPLDGSTPTMQRSSTDGTVNTQPPSVSLNRNTSIDSSSRSALKQKGDGIAKDPSQHVHFVAQEQSNQAASIKRQATVTSSIYEDASEGETESKPTLRRNSEERSVYEDALENPAQ